MYVYSLTLDTRSRVPIGRALTALILMIGLFSFKDVVFIEPELKRAETCVVRLAVMVAILPVLLLMATVFAEVENQKWRDDRW